MQVLLSDAELRAHQKLARQHGVTLSEWVRQALRRAAQSGAVGPPSRKLAAIRAASQHAFPAPDIDLLLAEIERGYTQEFVE